MNQMYVVQEENDLMHFLLQYFSKKEIKHLLKNKCVFVNEVENNKHDFILSLNDKVRIIKKYQDLSILYEDKYLIVVEKPFNMLTISDLKEKEKTLYHKVSTYLKEKNKTSKVFIVHRLDYESGGLVLFAKDKKIKEILQNDWKNVERKYQAIVHGKMEGKGILRFYLKENKNLFVTVTKNKENAKEAITNYKVISSDEKYSYLDISIETGRKHQIRVSLKEVNHPILGDKKYGDDSFKHLYLYAHFISFYHPILKKKITVEAIVPKSFKKIV